LCEGNHGIKERTVDILVDVDTFGRDTDLARIGEGAKGYLGCGAGDVNVWEDDARVVATELYPLVRENRTIRFSRYTHLKSDSFQRRRSCLHDLLASGDGARKRDFVDIRMSHQSRSKLIVTSQYLNEAG
jgi:hypothetical protein